jgi:hypothetical protein
VKRFDFPDGRRFAFTVVDDTDVATVANVKPVYDLLEQLGMRVTKTVWPVACEEGSKNFSSSETLADPAYRAFVLDLQRRGFEITWHGATMESSPRERTVRALERFRELLGAYPRVHVNHAENRENVYWGAARVDHPLLKRIAQGGKPREYFSGHIESSPMWWGDLCAEHIVYARNLTFSDINTARVNPSMPYRDPARPLVPWWFSASDADDVDEMNALLHPDHQARLEKEGGFCIVATHFGKRYVRDGAVDPTFRARLEALARRPGWFPTVGELLDWLRAQRGGPGTLPAGEWRRMQWSWARDLAARKLSERLRRRERRKLERGAR